VAPRRSVTILDGMKQTILAAAVIAAPLTASAFEADPEIQVVRWYADDYLGWVIYDVVAPPAEARSPKALCVAINTSGEPIASSIAYLQSGAGKFANMAHDVERIHDIKCRRTNYGG